MERVKDRVVMSVFLVSLHQQDITRDSGQHQVVPVVEVVLGQVFLYQEMQLTMPELLIPQNQYGA